MQIHTPAVNANPLLLFKSQVVSIEKWTGQFSSMAAILQVHDWLWVQCDLRISEWAV